MKMKRMMIILILLISVSACAKNNDTEIATLNSKIDALTKEVKALEDINKELEDAANSDPDDVVGKFLSVTSINKGSEFELYIYSVQIFQSEKTLVFHSKKNFEPQLEANYEISFDKNVLKQV